jgi:uncharacterized protein
VIEVPLVDRTLSRYTIASDPIGHREVGTRRRVLLSTRVNEPVTVSEAVWIALCRDRCSLLPADVIRALTAGGILVDRSEDELAAILDENADAIAQDDELRHVIQPSAACQLGCGYCGQVHVARHMSVQHQDMLVERLSRRLRSGRYTSLNVCWFGAEPLLGLGAMRRLSPRLARLASEHSAIYSSRIVTNGMRLTAAIASELQEVHHVRAAEVTLDGPEYVHDERRPTKSGGVSFGRILRNLIEIAAESEVTMELSLRCNVDHGNADSVSELIELLAEHGLHRRVSLSFAPVYSWGNDAHLGALSVEEFGAREIEWFAQMHNHGFRLDILPSRKPIVCLAVRREGELTDATGTVFNCTELSYVPAYGNPNDHAIGTLGSDRPEALAPFRGFNEEMIAGDHVPCRSCAVLPACGGACPKQWHEGNVPCPSIKANLSERLTLWYAINADASGVPSSA